MLQRHWRRLPQYPRLRDRLVVIAAREDGEHRKRERTSSSDERGWKPKILETAGTTLASVVILRLAAFVEGFPLQSIFSFSLRDVTCWQSLRRVPCARSIDSRRLILCVVGGAGNIALEGSHIAAPQAVELGDYRGVLQPRASVKNSKAPAGTIPQLFLFKKQQMWAVEAIVWTRMWKLKFYIYVRTIA